MDIVLAQRWVHAIAAAVDEHEGMLTQLDSAIGNADHGANMKHGFAAVSTALATSEPTTVGDVFTEVGTTLVCAGRGGCVRLYGSAFQAMGGVLDVPRADLSQFAGGLAAGCARIQQLSAAAPGDKTMLDAYIPALMVFQRNSEESGYLRTVAEAAARAAEDGMRATTLLRARRGRACFLGPRSVGHQDPGATSTALIFRALAHVVPSR
ncbi:dihydroxyacetone kinase subunit DhaL [Streptomyces sp. MZ04]|uniref:dihydroxyacetone kinase subunit DhaL n=1 Tax=Streptomyces sp. MZ04 TaxID=2559236 RepID=UPI00107E9A5E|nr:dihydroxyacetone kinase subunit DhaL [Streptomyces sp. MZ04]TGA90906.1 dihydroxyacetone kinase subunit L [Streptomyces sp. MZ04]